MKPVCKFWNPLAISFAIYYNITKAQEIRCKTSFEKGKTMRKIRSFAAVLAAAAVTLSAGFTASAATVDDVIAAAYAAGWPDWMVQEAVNMFSGGDYTPEQCDKAIAQIYQYDEAAGQQIAEQFGLSAPAPAVTTAPAGTSSGNETVTTTVTTQRQSDKTFVNATLDEKKEYLNSMTDKEKQEFVDTMTDEERNSVLKQLDAGDKAALISNFMEVGEEFGINFSIDEISGDNLVISASDENGMLVNVSSMSVSVDPTGKSRALPIIGGCALLLISAGGAALLLKGRKQED